MYTSDMATSKTSKKRTTTKASTAKRTKAKRSAAKPFALQTEERPFMSFQPTVQSLYWIILGIVVIAFTVWIMKLQSDIQAIYDNIDMNSDTTLITPTTKHHKADK